MRRKDFVSVADLDPARLRVVLERARRLKKDLRFGRPHPLLAGRVVALSFQQPSLRTRVSFDVRMQKPDGPRAIMYDQAENRVHAQKALLVELLASEAEWRLQAV